MVSLGFIYGFFRAFRVHMGSLTAPTTINPNQPSSLFICFTHLHPRSQETTDFKVTFLRRLPCRKFRSTVFWCLLSLETKRLRFDGLKRSFDGLCLAYSDINVNGAVPMKHRKKNDRLTSDRKWFSTSELKNIWKKNKDIDRPVHHSSGRNSIRPDGWEPSAKQLPHFAKNIAAQCCRLCCTVLLGLALALLFHPFTLILHGQLPHPWNFLRWDPGTR